MWSEGGKEGLKRGMNPIWAFLLAERHFTKTISTALARYHRLNAHLWVYKINLKNSKTVQWDPLSVKAWERMVLIAKWLHLCRQNTSSSFLPWRVLPYPTESSWRLFVPALSNRANEWSGRRRETDKVGEKKNPLCILLPDKMLGGCNAFLMASAGGRWACIGCTGCLQYIDLQRIK